MKRLALCIGNQDYKYISSLSCAIKDAESMATILGELGFETHVKQNLNNVDFASFIHSFDNKFSEYDAILFYYAGHGFQIDNGNILAPVDLNINDTCGLIKHLSFSIEELLASLGDNPEQTKIIIIDACRENLGTRGLDVQSFGSISAPRGSLLAFATSPGHSSKENAKSGHGYYTEALLKYISLPRVEIETVFKRVREELAVTTGGLQISWEHTSLIGSFYLNPKTIYDGGSYSQDALCDSEFVFLPGSLVQSIVKRLKEKNWTIQEKAISEVLSLNMSEISMDELFVLGRNIYQAADGKSFKCMSFIDRFAGNDLIPEEAKIHLLNGMAYEIYFNSKGEARNNMKTGYYTQVLACLERPAFYSSKAFINSKLDCIEDRLIYRPGQEAIMTLKIVTEKCYYINADDTFDKEYKLIKIYYQGQNILKYGDESEDECYAKNQFEIFIAKKLVAPLDYIKFQYEDDKIGANSFIVFDVKSLTLLNKRN